ncbi:MAG: hypothetical protein ACE5M4_13530 [Anaerolineales bacterium]
MMDNPKELYLEGYAAFDQGRFSDAMSLATRCLATASPDSYWHFGSLGLRCWAANFLGDNTSVERDADALLSEDAGSEKPWFDGLALLNLGLARYRAGRTTEAKELFAQASERYFAHRINSEHPPEWQLVSEFFAAATRWAAFGEVDRMKQLADKLASLHDPDKEMEHLSHAIGLYQRHAGKEDVRAEATATAREGVSRAFLAIILLEVMSQ